MYILSDFSNQLLIIIFMGVLGLCVGSFLNVIIYRFPIMIINHQQNFNIAQPRSHCPDCKTQLAWRDLIPILSFYINHKKCRFCKTRLSYLEPSIELLTAAIFIISLILCPDYITLVKTLIILCISIPLVIIDIKHQLLPDALTLSLLWSGLLAACINPACLTPCSAITGAAVGYCSLKGFAKIYELVRHRPAMGGGDFKLFAAIGAWSGYLNLPLVLFIASFLGSVITIIWRLVIRKNINELPLAFGPWLIIGWAGVWVLNYAKL